jgi:hypothetical protein
MLVERPLHPRAKAPIFVESDDVAISPTMTRLTLAEILAYD